MSTHVLPAVLAAVAHVLELPLDAVSESTRLADVGADSMALVVIADVIEARQPDIVVSDDALAHAITVGDLADYIERGLHAAT
jgi:acyl carrier protein